MSVSTASLTVKVKGIDEATRRLASLGHSTKGITATLSNKTAYAPFVGSQKYQAAVHNRRWKTDQGVLDELAPDIQADFDEAVRVATMARRVVRNPLVVAADVALKRIHDRMTDVPPPIPTSKYKRTNVYIRSWTSNVEEK